MNGTDDDTEDPSVDGTDDRTDDESAVDSGADLAVDPAARFTPRELAGFRAALAREAASARRMLASLGADIADIVEARQGSNNDDEHDPEGATLAFERSQADALRRSNELRLVEIDRAQERIRQGGFGICAVCFAPIADARLEARPWADRCVSCA